MADLDFDLTVARDDRGACRLTLRGELDLATVPRLEHALANAGEDVVLDLRGLTFMDSTGVRVLLEAAEAAGPGLRMIVAGGRRGARDDRRRRASRRCCRWSTRRPGSGT